MHDIDWGGLIWPSVAAHLQGLVRVGYGHLLTEDLLRFALAQELTAAGVEPGRVRAEWRHPALLGGKLDLLVADAHGEPAAVVELKFPREPKATNAAWTMILGELLRDFYRVAAIPTVADRWCALVCGRRLASYLAAAASSYEIDVLHGDFELTPSVARALPKTCIEALGPWTESGHALVGPAERFLIDKELTLIAYRVQDSSQPAEADGPIEVRLAPVTRDGARREILVAARAVLGRTGRPDFAVADVVAEMARRGTGYAESTIRTMVTSHMCLNAPVHATTTYSDFERVDRGRYRML